MERFVIPISKLAAFRLWFVWIPLLAWPAMAVGASSGAGRHTEVTLITEHASIQPGRPFTVALRMNLEDGWHTYWKNPGDAGLPLRIEWALPPGFSAGPIEWPAPERIPAPPLMDYGYGGQVVIPVRITPPAHTNAREVSIAGTFEWLECKEICLPAEAALDLRLPVRAEPPSPGPDAAVIAGSRLRLPEQARGWGLSAEAGPRAISLGFRGPDGMAPARGAYFFVDQPMVADYAAPQGFESTGRGHRLTLTPAPNAPRPDRLSGVLVVEGDEKPGSTRAIHVDVPVASGDPAPISTAMSPTSEAGGSGAGGFPSSGTASLPAALLFAFVGGLILNLMPCVLPVLSIKVLSFVEQSHREGAWRHGVVFTLGVLASFWALTGVLLLLRGAGEHVGWGFQLQSAPFLAGLSGLFLLMGLNLFGVFEVGASLTRSAGILSGKQGLAGSFWNGALATVAATPCTAPFMGSALGFALSQPGIVAFLVFTTLALGLSAPYLVLSLHPALLRFVPKPGEWMLAVKQLMGFLLMATVAALVWLFGQQTGVDGVGKLLAALVLIALAAWVYGRARASTGSGRGRVAGSAAAAFLLAIGLAVAWRGAAETRGAGERESSSALGLVWEAYTAPRLAQARAERKPVFIDFTAAWCLTCQVNERVALADGDVVSRFRREGIVALRADWTRRDDQITKALAAYGRQGVPVYVLYGRAPEAAPELLPELLTPGIVLATIDKTLGPARLAESRPDSRTQDPFGGL